MQTTQIHIKVPRAILREFKAECMRHDTDMTHEIVGFLQRRVAEWLQRPRTAVTEMVETATD